VHHSNFIINIGGTPVTTAGSVGVDGTLDLTVTVNVGGAIAEKLLPNQPILQKALAKQIVHQPQPDMNGHAKAIVHKPIPEPEPANA